MKILLIGGSPKGDKSTSKVMLDMLRRKLELPGNETTENMTKAANKVLQISELLLSTNQCSKDNLDIILEQDVLVVAFPLYVDGIPSHFLRCMMQIEEAQKMRMEQESNISSTSQPIRVCTIVNNGFFDAKQNHNALDMVKMWCSHCGFEYIQGMGVGGGGMLSVMGTVPDDAGPKKNVGIAMGEVAKNIKNSALAEDIFVLPAFPASLYKMAAQSGWRQALKANGVPIKEIGRRR